MTTQTLSFISQFRTSYPQGSIISELIAIDHGKYIVRVILQSDGQILATGLAGADTVEQAEDLARERACSVLLLNQVVTNQTPLDLIPKNEAKEPKKTKKSEPPALSLVPPPIIPEPPSVLENHSEKEKPLDKDSELTQEDPSSGDFVSDTIAQITIQMKRLGWTKEQGRDYLISTYGKKSRHLLSDEELREFLEYLKQQRD
jgi:hypothetical protein